MLEIVYSSFHCVKTNTHMNPRAQRKTCLHDKKKKICREHNSALRSDEFDLNLHLRIYSLGSSFIWFGICINLVEVMI